MHRCQNLVSQRKSVWMLCVGLLLAPVWLAWGAELDDARKLFATGKYQQCVEACAQVADGNQIDQIENWKLLQARALLALGRYPEAEGVISNALVKAENSLLLRELGLETAKRTDDIPLMRRRLLEINQRVSARSWAYRDPPNLVALGRVALLMGTDPKMVLEQLLMPARRAAPELRDAWLVSGQLALDKHDYALAAKTFSEAQKKFPEDADVLCGLAQAYQPSARSKMLELLNSALVQNENHVPSLLWLTDHLIDAEEYVEADRMLTRALAVNPWNPRAWAYRAVLAHLGNDTAGEVVARQNGLKYWNSNPEVDHLIGLKLSQKYRFAEGSAYQQQALRFDAGYLPARIQLAEDLLRLGEETDGWKLADGVHQQDGYDVTAYNLVTLHGTMQKFQTLTNEHFILRMGVNEAALYGDRALALLESARAKLTAKYGIALELPTVVEIFPEQKDFAVRTFGMPGNPGFLGVCFGRVITANSPASQGGHPANWEAVLWHEFCHVVTLQLTKNKMPRWLSEGISVYEELQANPAWGQRMNPKYREMVLGDDLTPVSKLSSAFMTPKSDLHVQFAYYQSALVVEYLVGKFGFEKLKAVLQDLGQGVDINTAISKHTGPMNVIEKEFATFAKAKAEALGPGLDWKKPDDAGSRQREEVDVLSFLNFTNPPPHDSGDPANSGVATKSSGTTNYWMLVQKAGKLVADKKWTEAKAPLQTLIQLYPDQSGQNNAYALLAAVHRGLNETNKERAALEKWATLESDALDAYARLMELAEAAGDWSAVAENAERYLAVNPLVPQPYRYLARASEARGETNQAIVAYEKLLLLDPADLADVHYQLARLLRVNNDLAARRHVVQALEEAPRFRDAHRLLLELAQADTNATNAPMKEIQ